VGRSVCIRTQREGPRPVLIGSTAVTEPDLEAADRAAQAMVTAHDLDFGFDVHTLCEQYADLIFVEIPGDVDAVLFGLMGEPRSGRPHIAINSARFGSRTNLADHQRRRLRFTIAHELGHLELGWHSGLSLCAEGGESAADDVGFGQSRFEDEAHLFAQRILVPRRRLARCVDSEPKSAVLEALDSADVHFSVALRSLVDLLPAGHIVAATKDNVVERAYRSRSTPISVPTWEHPLEAHTFNKLSQDRAVGRVGGRQIFWWELPSSTELVHIEEGVSSKKISRAIYDSLDLGDRLSSLRSSVTGKESTVMTAVRAGDLPLDPQVIAAHISQKVAADARLERIAAHPDFPRYLSARAHEIVRKIAGEREAVRSMKG